ncbi:hypothetical protein NA57DRAFT_55019 [Rhizodiscina lignyota]|uniref:BTB domain-containing protein n=1 Tax=Rhizodiscina lignyota TaxID=1504668 RepID=A0A9P4M7X2_9PEZI|nr:hypothetical protein NA57DRAFT_55019 [Rhizodiscina lignyota]
MESRGSSASGRPRAGSRETSASGRPSGDSRPTTSSGRPSADSRPPTSSGRSSGDSRPTTSSGRPFDAGPPSAFARYTAAETRGRSESGRLTEAAKNSSVETIIVKNNETFQVHKALLDDVSSSWNDFRVDSRPMGHVEVEKCISLPFVESQTFKNFLDWLHTKQLPQSTSNAINEKRAAHVELLKLHVFACQHHVPNLFRDSLLKLQNDAKRNATSMCAIVDVRAAVANLPPTSPWMRLLVDLFSWGATMDSGALDFSSSSDTVQPLPMEFLPLVLSRKFEIASGKKADPEGWKDAPFKREGYSYMN